MVRRLNVCLVSAGGVRDILRLYCLVDLEEYLMRTLYVKLWRRLFGVRSVQVFVAGECRFAEEDVVLLRSTRTGVKLWVLYEGEVAAYYFPLADEVRVSR